MAVWCEFSSQSTFKFSKFLPPSIVLLALLTSSFLCLNWSEIIKKFEYIFLRQTFSFSLLYEKCLFRVFSQTMNFSATRMAFTNISKHVIKHFEQASLRLKKTLGFSFSSNLFCVLFMRARKNHLNIFFIHSFCIIIFPSLSLNPRIWSEDNETTFTSEKRTKSQQFNDFRDDHWRELKIEISAVKVFLENLEVNLMQILITFLKFLDLLSGWLKT